MKDFFQVCDNSIKIIEKDDCTVCKLNNETGEGTITAYEVFPGVTLSYNDFNMQYYNSLFKTSKNVFCIDHCREGGLEYLSANDTFSYVEAGDLKLDNRLSHKGRFEMPMLHYRGVMISFEMEIAKNTLPLEINNFPVNLTDLNNKYCKDIYPTVIHSTAAIEHIFSELYAVPVKIKIPYFKIKIMELLLYLYALELPKQPSEKPYFYKAQIEKVKAIQKLITENIEEHFTQQNLSEKFGISLTSMKQCFKSVYGTTIGSYLTNYRMNQATVLLKTNEDISIAEIAGKVGYDSPSKFAITFRKEIGMSPTEYRNQIYR